MTETFHYLTIHACACLHMIDILFMMLYRATLGFSCEMCVSLGLEGDHSYANYVSVIITKGIIQIT